MVLYKYFPEERSSFFEQCMVRFTPANDFNDLLEGRGRYDWIVTPDQAVAEADSSFDTLFDQALLEVYESLPKELKRVLTQEQVRDLVVAAGQKDLRMGLQEHMRSLVGAATPIAKDALYDGLCKHLGIFCLSENPLNHMMWGYYTNHKGFAVGFDSTHEFFNKLRDADHFLGRLHQVTYVETLPRHESIATMSAEDMFLTKKCEWSHEAEWRMVDGLQFADLVIPGEPPVHLFKVPADALLVVVFGYRSSQALRETVTNQIQSRADLRHINLITLELEEESGSLKLPRSSLEF